LLLHECGEPGFLEELQAEVVLKQLLSLWNGDYQQAAKKLYYAKTGEVGQFQGNYQPCQRPAHLAGMSWLTPIFDSSGQVESRF